MNETTQLPSSVETTGVVYEDRNQRIDRVVARFDGFEKEYLVSDFGERAGVLVVRDGAVLMVRPYRLLINGLSHEIPGGAVDPGETPAESAARECAEETGVLCRDLRPLLDYYPGLDTNRNRTYVFCSTDSSDTGDFVPGSRTWIPLQTCLDMIFKNQILDALTVTAILAFSAKTGKGLGPDYPTAQTRSTEL